MIRLLLVAFCLLLPLSAQAVPLIQPGFRTLGFWDPATKIRLDFAIWYPTSRAPARVDFGDWTLRVARGAAPLPGQHPLIMLSHDSAGSRFSLHQLAAALTSNGFVVAAFTHPGDNIDDMQKLFTGEQIFERSRNLRAALDILLSDDEIAPLIDPQRIGILGVGPGGTAALLLAGARLDPAGWNNYCADPDILSRSETPDADPYCTPWAVRRMNAITATPNLGAGFRDRRVRVVAAVAPGYSMYLTQKALSRIRISLLLVTTDENRMAPALQTEKLTRALPASAVVQDLPGASTAALMSACSDNLAQTLPEMCFATSASTRENVQKRLLELTASFFLKHLGSPNPPPIPPDPPEPEVVVPVSKPAPAAPAASSKKKRRH